MTWATQSGKIRKMFFGQYILVIGITVMLFKLCNFDV